MTKSFDGKNYDDDDKNDNYDELRFTDREADNCAAPSSTCNNDNNDNIDNNDNYDNYDKYDNDNIDNNENDNNDNNVTSNIDVSGKDNDYDAEP